MKTVYEALLAEITEFARSHEKNVRFAHSVRTAETCAALCRRSVKTQIKAILRASPTICAKNVTIWSLFRLP